ncbi:MAG TPA: polymer-forming cytoskeletal protein [Steroidobacteraceae bacterium]|nr:polymer-forming cytoskeletal protein [Steroidobacteraceae bacterium]
MSENDSPRRRLLDQFASTPTYIAEGCRITGDVEAPGALVVGGSVRGDGDVKGPLNMASGASWEGQVRAQRAVIAGRINGSLSVVDKLEIGATAVIRGRVSARSVAIAKGAVIEGEVTVTSGEAVLSFDEKRIV